MNEHFLWLDALFLLLQINEFFASEAVKISTRAQKNISTAKIIKRHRKAKLLKYY